jgi:hypothetical protein
MLLLCLAAILAAAPAEASHRGRRAAVVLPAGSVDALAAAIMAAGPGGTVLLQPGVHSESGTVEVMIPVTLLGKRGAVLESVTDLATSLPVVVDAALHIRNTTGVTVKGLEIRPPEGEDGTTAVLIEDATNVLIEGNLIHGFMHGVMIQGGDRAQITRNRIDVNPKWKTGELIDGLGVVNINGTDVSITDNQISDGVFNIWACDRGGRASGNSMSNGFVGLILCKVPANNYLISGVDRPSSSAGASWDVRGNFASANDWGYLVIDGANNNTLINNAASGSGTYDMELTADTFRFGFLTPAAFDNTVEAGPHRLTIKDCGNNNTVTGGVLVDTTQDPCF